MSFLRVLFPAFACCCRVLKRRRQERGPVAGPDGRAPAVVIRGGRDLRVRHAHSRAGNSGKRKPAHSRREGPTRSTFSKRRFRKSQTARLLRCPELGLSRLQGTWSILLLHGMPSRRHCVAQVRTLLNKVHSMTIVDIRWYDDRRYTKRRWRETAALRRRRNDGGASTDLDAHLRSD